MGIVVMSGSQTARADEQRGNQRGNGKRRYGGAIGIMGW